MITAENISIFIQVCTLIGIVFAVYLYFRKPQEKSEMNDALFNQRLDSMRELVINLRDNHIHTLESKLDSHIADNQKYVESDIKWKAKLETVIEERLPAKK